MSTRHTDPVTSHQAAASTNRQRTSDLVLTVLRWDGALTDEAIHTAATRRGWRVTPSGTRTRRHELTVAGLVEPAGTGHTRSGRSAVVWQLTPAGHHAAETAMQRLRGTL